MVLASVKDRLAPANVTVGTFTGKRHPDLAEDATSRSLEDLAAMEAIS